MELSAIELLVVVLKRFKLIFFLTISIVFFSVILSLVLPPKYEAEIIIMPKRLEYIPQDSLQLAKIGLPIPSHTYYLPILTTPSNLYAEIIKSAAVLDRLIYQFDLKKYYKKKYVEDVRKKLSRDIHVKLGQSGLVFVYVTNKDRSMARDMANQIPVILNQLLVSEDSNIWGSMEEFLVNKLVNIEDSIRKVEKKLDLFKKRYTLVEIDKDLENYTRIIHDLELKRLNLEFNKKLLLNFSDSSLFLIKHIEQELRAINNEIKRVKSEGLDHYLKFPFNYIPSIYSDYMNLKNEYDFLVSLYEAVFYEYQYAKLMRNKRMPIISVIKQAELPEKRSSPQRKKMVIFSLIIAVYLGIIMAFLLEFFEKVRSEPHVLKLWKKLYRL